jgi:hypothetical protein
MIDMYILYYLLYIQVNVRENRRAINNVLKVILHQLLVDQFKLFLSIVLFRLILFYWMVCRKWEDFKLHIMLS